MRRRVAGAGWWRRFVAVAVTGVLAAGLGVVALVIGVNLQHPRDEAAYLTYLRTYGDMSSDRPIELPPRPGLIAVGQDACSWLSGSDFALWRTDRRHQFPARMDAYLQSPGASAPLPWRGLPERSTVAAAAWTYLCPATWQLHRPRYIFTPAPDD